MPAPDLSTRQIALLFKDLVHYVFGASGTVFTNNFLSISIFYPALRKQGFPKFMQAGDLSKLEFQRLSTHITWELLLLILERYRPRKRFFLGQVISISTPSSHWELFISVCCPTTYQTDVMNNFLHANIIQKEFNLLQMEQVDSWLHPSLLCERFLALRCSLTSPLVASLTSSQIYKHILALKEFSQTTCIFRFRKKAFQFELLFYCLLFAKLLLWILTCLTWAQPSNTYKNWTNREMHTAYQKWSRISLWLSWISERAFVH